MSAYVFVSVAGGSLGLLAGGVLTEALSWHWIFFVNVPIGLATLALGKALVPSDRGLGLGHGIDWLGSILVTVALMIGVYAIVEATSHGWASVQVLGFGALSIVLLGAFLALESRLENPIMPLRILSVRGLVASSVVRGFLVTGMYSTFFLGTLYLEHIRHLSALQTGLAYLPWTITVAIMSLGVTSRLVARFGGMRVLVGGMVAVIAGLVLLTTTGPQTAFFPTIGRRVLPDRARDRHRVHATAADRDGQRARRRRRAGLGHRQRLPADLGSARSGGAVDDRHQPHEDVGSRGQLADRRADRRLPPRVHDRRGGGRGRDRRGAGRAANPARASQRRGRARVRPACSSGRSRR